MSETTGEPGGLIAALVAARTEAARLDIPMLDDRILYAYERVRGPQLLAAQAAELAKLREENTRLGGKTVSQERNADFWFSIAVNEAAKAGTPIGEAIDAIGGRDREIADLRARHHREIGAHLAGQHDHADDCAGCTISADDREVIAQLREELEEVRARIDQMARQAIVSCELIERTQEQRAQLTADLAAARAELDEATKGGEWEWGVEKDVWGGAREVFDGFEDEAAARSYAASPAAGNGIAVRRYVGPWQPAPAADDTAGRDGPRLKFTGAVHDCGPIGSCNDDEPKAGQDGAMWTADQVAKFLADGRKRAIEIAKAIDCDGQGSPCNCGGNILVTDENWNPEHAHEPKCPAAQAGQDAAGGDGR